MLSLFWLQEWLHCPWDAAHRVPVSSRSSAWWHPQGRAGKVRHRILLICRCGSGIQLDTVTHHTLLIRLCMFFFFVFFFFSYYCPITSSSWHGKAPQPLHWLMLFLTDDVLSLARWVTTPSWLAYVALDQWHPHAGKVRHHTLMISLCGSWPMTSSCWQGEAPHPHD